MIEDIQKPKPVQKPRYILLKISFLLFVVAGGMVLTVFIRTPYRESTDIGYIKSFGREGILFKAWEGSFKKLDSPADSVFAFSVYEEDEGVQKVIQNAALYHQTVRVEFQEKYFRFFWQPKSTRIITGAVVDSTLLK